MSADVLAAGAAAGPAGPDCDSRAERRGPRVRTLAEWLTDPVVATPPRWVLPPFVQAGEVALLSAPPKMGKSQLVSQLAADLSAGGTALDGTALAAAPVLWLAVDESVRRLVPRLNGLGADLDRMHVYERDPGQVLTADALARLMSDIRPALVVLDTTSQLALDSRVEMNDAVSVNGFLRPLVDAVRGGSTADAPCAGMFIHHAPHHAKRAAGSQQWGAVPDAIFVLSRPGRGGPSASDGEDADDPGPEDGRRILSGTTRAEGAIHLAVKFADGRYASANPLPLAERIRTHLATMDTGPGCSSAAALRDQLGGSDKDVAAVLRRLREDGVVLVQGGGPTQHYVLAERAPAVDDNGA